MSWQQHVHDNIDDYTVPFTKTVTLKLTPQAVTLINTLAKQHGMSRANYIRQAIHNQLITDGIDTPPNLTPYQGTKVRRDPVATWQHLQERDIT